MSDMQAENPEAVAAATLLDEAPMDENVAEQLLGRKLTAEELAEGTAYDDLRLALRAARSDAGLSQAEVAGRLSLGQSEVSRLETTVGPGSRIGRIRNYLESCQARLSLRVRTAAGREVSVWSDADEEARGLATLVGQVASALTPLSVADTQNAFIDHIIALDESSAQIGLDPEQANQLRHAFLKRLQRRTTSEYRLNEVGAGRGSLAGSVVDVEDTARAGLPAEARRVWIVPEREA